MFEVQLPRKEGDVRVTTAFNRMLELPGASVQDVTFGSEGVIVTVGLKRRRRVCSGCGAEGLETRTGGSDAGGILTWAPAGA